MYEHNKTNKHNLNSGSKVITWSAIGSSFFLWYISELWHLKLQNQSIQLQHEKILDLINYKKIPFYRTSREINMFTETFQEFLSLNKHIKTKPTISVY